MSNETREAILLSPGGWNSYNMGQAAPEDAQKSKILLYLVSLKSVTLNALRSICPSISVEHVNENSWITGISRESVRIATIIVIGFHSSREVFQLVPALRANCDMFVSTPHRFLVNNYTQTMRHWFLSSSVSCRKEIMWRKWREYILNHHCWL